VNLVRGVAEEIRRNGRVVRGWTGVAVQNLPPDLVDDRGTPVRGVQVLGFYRGSTGQDAGLARGDLLTELAGKPLTDTQSFLLAIARQAPGATLELKGIRPGRGRFETKIAVVERPR
jgi:S1-C subfamily serine protease